MFKLAGSPGGGTGSDDFLGIEPISAFPNRLCVTVEHDQRGGARRMCRREQRSGRERPVERDEDRFATPQIVQDCGDAVGPLLQGRQRPGRDGIGGSGARLVKIDEPTERRHRLDPPLNGR
jgi:hypothetical protein